MAIIALRGNVIVESIDVAGDLGLDRRTLLATLPQKSGQPLLEDRMLRGVYRLEDLYRERGFFAASVRLEVRSDEARKRAAVVYRVAAGERARVGAVAIDEPSGKLAVDAALAALRARPGQLYDATLAREDPERLLRHLYRLGFRTATVAPGEPVVDADRRQVDLAYRVTLGPKIVVEIAGAKEKELTRHDLLPFLGDAGFDEALVLQAIDRIRGYYQDRGYYRVRVERSERRDPDLWRLRLEVVPGDEFQMAALRFTGNESFPAERLERLFATSPRRLLARGSGRLVDDDLSTDLANLRLFYALQGFAAARVGPAIVAESGRRLTVEVPIVEGVRRRVSRLALEGLEGVTATEARAALALAEGGPFHRLLLEQSVEQLRSLLESRGYREALVGQEVAWNDDQTLADVRLRVLSGRESRVEAVLVRGGQKTDPRYLRRATGLLPGDPISTAHLLEAQRNLYRLGIFSRVGVSTPRALEGTADEHEVVVDVEEGSRRSRSFGLGYDSESGARGLVRFGWLNLFGRAASLQLDLLASQKEERYRLLFRQPMIGGRPFELRSLVYREGEKRDSFDVARRGLQLVGERQFGRASVSLAYDYRIVDTQVFDPEVFNLPRESTNAHVASLTPALTWDRRDDPIEPTRGWLTAVQVERAAPVFDADANFLKAFLLGSGYLPLARWGTLALSVRFGGLEPFGRSRATAGQPFQSAIPPSELFFAGGRTSHRAYDRDELGIPGETLSEAPIDRGRFVARGGAGLGLLNFDWRFPILGDFGGVVFYDAGNIWTDWRDIDPRRAKGGLGCGLRYLSPIGPLRLEIGWKLDRLKGESPYVWFFSLGNPF